MIFYNKIKGRVEDAVKALDLPQVTIFRPGLLANRRNDERKMEKFANWLPFMDKWKIESSVMGEAMLKAAWAVKLG